MTLPRINNEQTVGLFHLEKQIHVQCIDISWFKTYDVQLFDYDGSKIKNVQSFNRSIVQ